MSDVLFVEYPKCSTCRRAKAWLDEHGVSYTDRHIVEDNPTADELAVWQERSGLPVRRFFNTSGRLYRERNVKALLDAGLSDADAFALADGEPRQARMFAEHRSGCVDDGAGR